MKKFHFLVDRVLFLEYVVSEDGLMVDDSKIKIILQPPQLQTIKKCVVFMDSPLSTDVSSCILAVLLL